MDNVEAPLLQDLSIRHYYRYVDDTLITARNRDEAELVFARFNAANG
jgi:hypothetical protein